jgi:carbon-monoxide dehydrogenase small subunit
VSELPSGIRVTVNGTPQEVTADVRTVLIDLIRDHLGLTASRVGCRTGDCGACTLWVDGRLTKACLVLACCTDGCEVTTLEGMDSPILRGLQREFVTQNAFQCGYCTTGMLLAAVDLLQENPVPDDQEIREAISGNLCRCTGYDSIVAAIRSAAIRLNEGECHAED